MTPLEKIKNGILSKNWKLVVDGYNAFADKKIVLDDDSDDDFIRVRNDRPKKESKVDEFSIDQQARGQRDDDKVDARVEPFRKKKRINMWSDDGDQDLIDYSKEDKKFDISNRNKKKTARPAPYKPVRISCYGCGKLFDVNPIHVSNGSYICDNCCRRNR